MRRFALLVFAIASPALAQTPPAAKPPTAPAAPTGDAVPVFDLEREVVVAPDGTGDFKTVQAAIDAAPDGAKGLYLVRIKPGTYKEKMTVPKTKGPTKSLGEDAAIFGLVAEFDPLAGPGENNVMIAHHRAAAQRGEADRAGLARPGVAIAHTHAVFRKPDGAAARGGLAKQQRGARGRIDLVTVVHFEDFDVEIIRPERFRGLLDQHGETVSLSSLKGRPVLVYFYPKADTPGCTKQACGLNEVLGDIGDAWSFEQLWVSASFALWFVAAGLTLGGVVPAQQAALEALETGGDTAAARRRIGVAGGLAMLAWTAIVVLMVVKPGV